MPINSTELTVLGTRLRVTINEPCPLSLTLVSAPIRKRIRTGPALQLFSAAAAQRAAAHVRVLCETAVN